MQDDNFSTPTRRKVLKSAGSAAAVGALGVSSVAAQTPGNQPNGLPDGTRMFVGGGVTFDSGGVSTSDVERTGVETTGLGNADLVLVSPKTNVSRGNLMAALKQGKPIATVGKRAFDGLLSTVYDVEHDKVGQALKAGDAEEGIDLPYSVGFEYSEVGESDVALAVPANGALHSFRLREATTSLQSMLSFLGGKFVSEDKAASTDCACSLDASTLAVAASICPPGTGGSGEWNCMGSDSLNVTSPCPYGGWERTTWGAKLEETDYDYDWWAWETKKAIRPSSNENSNCSSTQWNNNFMGRTVNFNDGIIENYGPPTNQNKFSTSKQIGFGLTAGFKSVEGTASVSFSHTESRSGVKVGAFSGNNNTQVDYDFNIHQGGNVYNEEFIAHLGQRQRTENNLSSTDYSYDDRWEWYNPDGIPFTGHDYHEETDYGTGYWSA